MLSRQKIGTIVFIGTTLLSASYFVCSILPGVDARHRKDHTELRRLTAVEFLNSIDELDGMSVEVSDLEIAGDPFQRKDSVREVTDYVLVGASEGGDSQVTCLVVGAREKAHLSIGEKIASGRLTGRIERDLFSELDEDTQAYLQENFPDVDFEETTLLWYDELSAPWLRWVMWGVFAMHLPYLAFWIYLLCRKEKKQPWQDAIDNDRTEIYRQNQKAMRLIGNDSFSDGSLRHRSVDSDFDVAPVKEVKHRKPKQFLYFILALAAYVVVSVWMKRQIRDSEWLANIDSLWLELGMILPLAVGFSVLSAAAKSSATGRGEEEIDRDKASYRNNEFHQYHDRVLNELGFVEVGDFKQIGSLAKLTRTIYLSPNGNLLVEIGTQTGHAYFTLESLTNGDKFLETHSMISQKLEMRNESKVHQRRTADHQDIIKALETHDELVSEFTFAGSSHEAKFTEENFARFLAYPSVKKLS